MTGAAPQGHALMPTPSTHPDTCMVDALAEAMTVKLACAREKGRGGWDNPEACTAPFLHDLLREHVVKENLDMVDVANLAGMLWMRMATVPGDREAVQAHLITLRGDRPRPQGVPAPDGLTPRQQDAALGEALGLCVWVRGGSLENPVRALVPLEHDPRDAPAPYALKRASDWNKAPRYSSSRELCHLAEAQIERLGLLEPYLARLVVASQNEQFRPALAALALASPAARVRAMLAALSAPVT